MTSDLLTPERKVLLPGHVLDLHAHRLTRSDGQAVELRPQALALLCELAEAQGRVLIKSDLLARVWPGVVVTDDSLVQAISDVRRAIGDDAHQVVQTVPRRGYRLRIDAPAVVAPPPSAVAAPEAASSRARSWALLAFAVLLIGAGLAAWKPWRAGTQAPIGLAPDRPPIAVLNFRDPTASAEDQAMARAYAIELSGELARNADLQVIAAYSSFKLGDADHSPQQVAGAVGARYLVDGQLRRQGDTMQLGVQLIDGVDGRIVWAERQSIAVSQVYAVRDALVDRIAGSLHSTLRHDVEAVARLHPPASMDIYAMTLQAITLKHRFSAEATREAQALLERVVALDPGYAPGWLYLGYVNTIDLEQQLTGPRTAQRLAQAQQQVERSIALNPSLPPAYAALLFLHQMNGRFDDAVAAGRRCVALGPSDVECRIFLASALVWTGQSKEALEQARRAVAMNPIPPVWVLAFYGEVLWANREFDAAIAALDDCLRQSPGWLLCRLHRMVSLAEAGRLDAARVDGRDLRRAIGGAPLRVLVDEPAAPAAEALRQRRMQAVLALESVSAVSEQVRQR